MKIENTISELTGKSAIPVRMIYFDKSIDSNWSLGWHQDRTIAVRQREDVDGFNVWTSKGGVQHVEPPFAIIESSITIRIGIDPSDSENGALEVIPGSHKLGRLTDNDTKQLAESEQQELVNMKEGDIAFFSSPIVHRSAPSRTAKRRRTIQIDYSSSCLPPPLEWAFVQ